MTRAIRAELEQLGLSDLETQVYLVLVENPSRSASSIAAATGLSRTSVYQMLGSLADKGLIEAGAGYGSRFSVLPPEEALTSLVVRERAMLAERECLARSVGQQLASLLPATEAVPEELVQVIRHPKVMAERFARLQSEAKHSVDAIVKAPILGASPSNPGQQEAQRRGVRFRGLYERAAIEQPDVQPYVAGWIAGGEEARVWGGELPHKLAIFDKQVVLLPLIMPGTQTKALLIRHPQLATSLTVLFEFYWSQAKPVLPPSGSKRTQRVRRRSRQIFGANSGREASAARQANGEK